MYDFSYQELIGIEDVVGFTRIDFPRAAYRFWHCLKDDAKIEAAAVEDFVIAYMSQYNKKVRANTF